MKPAQMIAAAAATNRMTPPTVSLRRISETRLDSDHDPSDSSRARERSCPVFIKLLWSTGFDADQTSRHTGTRLYRDLYTRATSSGSGSGRLQPNIIAGEHPPISSAVRAINPPA